MKIYILSYIDLNNPIYIYSYVYITIALTVIFVLQSPNYKKNKKKYRDILFKIFSKINFEIEFLFNLKKHKYR